MHDLLDAKAHSYEIVAENVPAELAAKIRAGAALYRDAAGTITAKIPGATGGPELAAAVVAAGGRLLSLVPERETLESWFVRLTSVNPTGDTADSRRAAKEPVR
jgi:hypothetical protein